MRHPREVDLPITVDRSSPVSLATQITLGVREAIETGLLLPGDPLPSTRAWAKRLAVSRGTIVAAFEQLDGEGWLVADRGATRVDPDLARHPRAVAPRAAAQPQPARTGVDPAPAGLDLRPGWPDVSRLVDQGWRAAWRAAADHPWTDHPAEGSVALRTALAEHLRLTRGTNPEPQELMITAGVREGLQLLLTVLALDRRRPLLVAVEDPGFPALRQVVTSLGHRLLPIAVDEHGLGPELLTELAQSPDLLLLTPGHQYPLGGAMPVSRRLDLLGWAQEHDALLIEDDYDGELRFDGPPLPALAALDRRTSPHGDRVVMLGSFAKLLAPGLGIGHILPPASLRPALVEHRRAVGGPVPAIVQDALTAYLQAGELRRHTSRMRRLYRQRRSLAVQALGDIEEIGLRPMDGGLHCVIELHGDPGVEPKIIERCREAGLLVSGLSQYWSEGSPARPQPGLVIGLGSADLPSGLQLLRRVLTRRD